jgi:hypothetical protein
MQATRSAVHRWYYYPCCHLLYHMLPLIGGRWRTQDEYHVSAVARRSILHPRNGIRPPTPGGGDGQAYPP